MDLINDKLVSRHLVGEKLIYTENSDKDGHTFQTIISDIQTTLADLKTRVETLEG